MNQQKPQIILARTSGFCMGVKRAMQMALDTAKKNPGAVFTCGPLIHNPQAVEFLKNHGVDSIDDWNLVDCGTIIIRAHGMPRGSIEEMQQKKLHTVDATCPHVVTSQKKIRKFSDDGFFIYIIGDPEHPEIQSLQSFASNYKVISSFDEANNASFYEKIMIIAQTTFNAEQFQQIAEELKNSASQAIVCDSICRATFDRQKEITLLASDADAVVIVGGRSSANTRRLAQIAEKLCPRTFHVETAEELKPEFFQNTCRIVVSAGASTPDFITAKVIDFLNELP